MTKSLRIMHCMRTPVGGLFRHVRDLATEQSLRGHQVGILCDSSTGGAVAEQLLSEVADHCALGIHRIAMSRQIGPKDVSGYSSTKKLAAELDLDILHGHGAKGGAFARLAGRSLKKAGQDVKTFYTPHGGSLHYSRTSPQGLIFLTLERLLSSLTDGMIFESQYSSDVFDKKVGVPSCKRRVIPNGLREDEFVSISPEDDAADFVFVGELRTLKGVGVLIEALADIRKARQVRAVIVGSGPDEETFKQSVLEFGLGDCVHFAGRLPARDAFKLGRCLVIPSFAESFPYIVLEAAGASIPLITTRVGGIPEIVGNVKQQLIEPQSVDSLAAQLLAFLDAPEPFRAVAGDLHARVRDCFNVQQMTQDVLAFYSSS